MAGMGLSGGFAAGGGADALEEVLKRAFLEQTERRRAKQEDRRIGQEDTRLAQQAEMQKAALASQDESRKAAADDRAQKMLMGKLSLMAPGSQVDPGLAAEGRAAGLGPMLPHQAADLPSTAISGMAQAGAKAPLMGQLRMAAAGRPERDMFTGTDEQLTAQQGRQDALSRTAQARTDRAEQLAQAAQDRRDAAAAAQQGRVDLAQMGQQGRADLARLAAGLKGGGADGTAAQAKQQNEVQDSLSLIDEIRRDPALKASVGPAEGRGMGMMTAGPEGYTRVKALHDNLVNKLQLAQAGKLKGQGQISNMEREMLKNAATALDRTLGDADYLKQLDKIEVQFKRMQGVGQPASGPVNAGQEFDYVPGKGLVPRKQ